MNSRWTAIGLLGALVYALAAGAEQVSRAEFAAPAPAYVSFWQMGRVELGGQGWCVAKFGFDGSNLGVPVEDLTIAVRVFDKDGKDKGAGQIQLRTLGGDHASWVKDASFDGLDIPEWKAIVSDVGSSPLCWDGISLVFESAAGTQGGRRVDLLQYGQLHYVVPKLLKVTLKHKRG